ncbi:MAG: hypothetical protein K6G90_08350 [Clostridia bacterium]|nr:hypothetical protein [Clostridia bacterium]
MIDGNWLYFAHFQGVLCRQTGGCIKDLTISLILLKQHSLAKQKTPFTGVFLAYKRRDSNPERVSRVKKTLRWSVFSGEVRSGCASRDEKAYFV